MAAVIITDVAGGEVAVVADANATINSWNTQSANVLAENIRDEGLDHRNFLAEISRPLDAQSWPAPFEDDGSAALTHNVATLAVAASGPVIQDDLRFDKATGESLRIRCSFDFFMAGVATGGGVTRPRFEAALYYSIDYAGAANWTLIDGSSRWMMLALDDVPVKGSITIVIDFLEAAVAVANTDVLTIGLFVWSTLGPTSHPFTIRHINFFCRKKRL